MEYTGSGSTNGTKVDGTIVGVDTKVLVLRNGATIKLSGTTGLKVFDATGKLTSCWLTQIPCAANRGPIAPALLRQRRN